MNKNYFSCDVTIPNSKPHAKKQIICEFCNGNHNCRDCTTEKQLKKTVTKNIGKVIEDYIAQNIPCRHCNEKSLYHLDNNTPSCDIKCSNCNMTNIEVKSKCLSVTNLPNDIQCKAGNYNHFIENIIDNQLDLIIVIYSVDRKSKCITFREIYYLYNDALINIMNTNILSINETSYSSIINIKNRKSLFDFKLTIKKPIVISLEDYINQLKCYLVK
uniref:Uncharacterized protein n=1 Tax=viral metagenome TaxID=1070528 RepID=A0A6C0D9V6_9ZZZZ